MSKFTLVKRAKFKHCNFFNATELKYWVLLYFKSDGRISSVVFAKVYLFVPAKAEVVDLLWKKNEGC